MRTSIFHEGLFRSNINLAGISVRLKCRSVKYDIILAEEQLAWAKKSSGYLREDQVKRLELAAQLARLTLERAEQPEIAADLSLHAMMKRLDDPRSEDIKPRIELSPIVISRPDVSFWEDMDELVDQVRGVANFAATHVQW